MAREACDLGREELEGAPALRDEPALGVREGGHLLGDAGGVPAVGEPREPLQLRLRQAERLADVANGAAGAVGSKARDERRVLVAIALRHGHDQLLANVAGEVEVDVRDRGQLVVEEAAQGEVVCDRIDVREAGQVADDRADRAAATASRRQEAAGRVAAAHLQGALACQLQHLPVEEEEAGQPELVDQRELGLEALACPCQQAAVSGWVAIGKGVVADLGQLPDRRLVAVGEVRIAVAELLGQVEPEAICELDGARHGGGVDAGEAVGDLGRGTEHALAVATPLLLAAVEGGAAADRHERVLEQRAPGHVSVHIAGGDGVDAEIAREIAQGRVAAHVSALVRPLQFDEKAVSAERRGEPGGRARVAHRKTFAGAAGEADEALRVRLQERLADGRG